MTPEEQEILIDELEKDIDRLHALYNQYFMGIEKMEPLVVRKNLDRKINLLRREQIKNTALRFRMQMQIQKYNTQSTYWTRICRQIEEGTYNRQIMLANKRINARHAHDGRKSRSSQTDMLAQRKMEENYPAQIDIDISSFSIDLDDPFATNDHFDSLSKLLSGNSPDSVPTRRVGIRESMDLIDDPFVSSAIKPTLPKVPPIPKPIGNKPFPPPLPTVLKAAPVLDEEEAKSVYRRYLAARKKCNESIDNISFDSVAKSLNAKLTAESGKVEFKVVIREGKAIIKTVRPTDSSK
jgi:hypothetical protein